MAMFEPHHFKRAEAEPALFKTLNAAQITTACSCLNVPNPTHTSTKTDTKTITKTDSTKTVLHTVTTTKKVTATHIVSIVD